MKKHPIMATKMPRDEQVLRHKIRHLEDLVDNLQAAIATCQISGGDIPGANYEADLRVMRTDAQLRLGVYRQRLQTLKSQREQKREEANHQAAMDAVYGSHGQG